MKAALMTAAIKATLTKMFLKSHELNEKIKQMSF